MSIDSWKSQLRKGAAELAVLGMLKKKDLSGIGLLDELSTKPEIGLSDGSVYPLLNRLEREGRIKGVWVTPKNGGHGQKLYSLTPKGRAALKSMSATWSGFKVQLTAIVGESS